MIWSLLLLAFTTETQYDTAQETDTGPEDTSRDGNKQNVTNVNGSSGSSVTDSDQSVNII